MTTHRYGQLRHFIENSSWTSRRSFNLHMVLLLTPLGLLMKVRKFHVVYYDTEVAATIQREID